MNVKKIPILILCYNKLHSLKRIISIIKKNRYINIYISLDGPISKSDKLNLNVLHYLNKLKLNKSIKIKIHKKNKGCKKAVVEGINWFFKNENKGIILEEDCIPDESFFKFCFLLLKKFEKNKRIGQISGTNPLEAYNIKASYFYSNYGGIWGWATWRDRWKKYDVEMKDWKKYRKFKLFYKSKNIFDFILRYYQFNQTYKNKIDTWDYQWTFSKIKNNYLTIIPKQNLISNVGFNKSAKHTYDKNNTFSNLKKHKVKFPLLHNDQIEHCKRFYDRVVKKRILNLLKKING